MKRMNKKQIESRIKMEASQVEIPDLKQQILAQVPNRKVVVKNEKKRFNFAIRFSYIMTILVIAVVTFLLINKPNGNSGIDSGSNTPQTITKVVGDVERVYAKQAVTLAGFTTESSNVEPLLLSNDNSINYDDIAGKINEYFGVVSSLIDEADCSIEVLENNTYQYKMTVKYKMLNDLVETIIYYNEKATDEKYKDEDDLDELETEINGIIIQNGKRNEFYGEKEIEEDEIEVELTLVMENDEYLKVSHEKESGERDLTFGFYKGRPNEDNDPYKEFNVEVKEENGKKDVKVEFKHKDGMNEDDFTIDFSFGKDGNVDIRYEDKKHGEHNGIKVHEDDEHKDHFKYDFGEGKGESSIKKPHGNDHDDDEWDEDHEHDHDDKWPGWH